MNIYHTFLEIYRSPLRIIETCIYALVFALLISLIQNSAQVFDVFGYSLPVLQKASVIFSILLNLYTVNLVGTILFLHIVVIILTAINITWALYYFKKKGSVLSPKRTVLGTIFALLGSGCAACGAALASTSFATIAGVSSVLQYTYTTHIFMYLAICILGYSIYSIAEKIQKPFVC
jgi:hypothetical protein